MENDIHIFRVTVTFFEHLLGWNFCMLAFIFTLMYIRLQTFFFPGGNLFSSYVYPYSSCFTVLGEM